jgi:hypothetical protein
MEIFIYPRPIREDDEEDFNNITEDYNSQMEVGKVIEQEHKPTYKMIKQYLAENGELPSPEAVYESISRDHILESENFQNKNYYDMLVKMEKMMKKGESW